MAIDPSAAGRPSDAHVSLYEAGVLARSQGSAAGSPGGGRFQVPAAAGQTPSGATTRIGSAKTAKANGYTPHTPVQSKTNVDANQWDSMLNRLGAKYNVPPLFLKAVMLSESAGRPDAVGDQGHSVGLFQLHDQGYGAGMGDSRFDPEINADRGARGLAEAWHAGAKAGYSGEYAVRAAYNYSFNPGGGWAYQGDSVVNNYNRLLQEQGLAPLN